jgi:predicted DCC family thiol-disulfide oxidoreductase YuxK
MIPENAPVLFYDGRCNLCHWAVKYVVKRDKNKAIFLAPLQGKTAIRLLPMEKLNVDTVVLLEGSKMYIKSKAAFRVAKLLGFPVSLWSLFGLFPGFFTDWIYDAIAKRRYRWWGKRATCDLPVVMDYSQFLP